MNNAIHYTCNLYLDADFLQGLRENVKEHFNQNFVDHMFDMAITLRESANGRLEKGSSSQIRSVNVSQGPQEQQSSDNPVQQSVPELVRHFEKIQNTSLGPRQEDTRRHIHGQTGHKAKLIEYERQVCGGTFIWRVDNFRQCHQEAIDSTTTATHSPPFYTSPPAAKLARHCWNVQCDCDADEMRQMVTALEQGQEDTNVFHCELHRKKVRLIASN